MFCHYIRNVKNNVHHHIKIMHTWYQLQSLKAWHLVQIVVSQRNLTVAQFNNKTIRRAKAVSHFDTFGSPSLDMFKTIQFPHQKMQCLHSFTTQQEEKLKERLETINN